ncbi:MAG TPA: hypothetical protein VGD58_29735, partial [Herpetosiphonaceae bacterium]
MGRIRCRVLQLCHRCCGITIAHERKRLVEGGGVPPAIERVQPPNQACYLSGPAILLPRNLSLDVEEPQQRHTNQRQAKAATNEAGDVGRVRPGYERDEGDTCPDQTPAPL